MRRTKKSVFGIWNEVLEWFWELRTDFGSAFVVISHNRVARVLVIAFASAAVVLALLWADAVWTTDQYMAKAGAAGTVSASASASASTSASASAASAADNPNPFMAVLNNRARLQAQNTALKEQIDSLAAQNSELERQNGDLLKKFSELSKPS